jgi:hypothetical protein
LYISKYDSFAGDWLIKKRRTYFFHILLTLLFCYILEMSGEKSPLDDYVSDSEDADALKAREKELLDNDEKEEAMDTSNGGGKGGSGTDSMPPPPPPAQACGRGPTACPPLAATMAAGCRVPTTTSGPPN